MISLDFKKVLGDESVRTPLIFLFSKENTGNDPIQPTSDGAGSRAIWEWWGQGFLVGERHIDGPYV